MGNHHYFTASTPGAKQMHLQQVGDFARRGQKRQRTSTNSSSGD